MARGLRVCVGGWLQWMVLESQPGEEEWTCGKWQQWNTGGVNRLEVMVDHRIVGESAGMRGKDRSW